MTFPLWLWLLVNLLTGVVGVLALQWFGWAAVALVFAANLLGSLARAGNRDWLGREYQ